MSKDVAQKDEKPVTSNQSTGDIPPAIKKVSRKRRVLRKGRKATGTLMGSFFCQMRASLRLFTFTNIKTGVKRYRLLPTIISIVIIAIFLYINTIDINLFGFFIPKDSLRSVYGIIISVPIILVFFVVGTVGGPRLGNLLVTQKIAIMVFTKGDKHYFEKYLDEGERHVAPGMIIGKFITLILVWVSWASFFLTLLATTFFSKPARTFIQDPSLLNVLLSLFIILFFSPLCLSFLIPVGWLLMDIRLKAYDSRNKVAWLVGAKIDKMIRNIITISALLGTTAATAAPDKILDVLFILLYSLCWIGIPCIIVVTLYHLLLTTSLYDTFVDYIDVPFGVLSITLEEEVISDVTEEKSAETSTNDDKAKVSSLELSNEKIK